MLHGAPVPNSGTWIHGASKTNCMPPDGTKVHHNGTEMTNSIRLAAKPRCFAQRGGATRIAAAATAGQASSADSTQRAYMAYRTAVQGTASTPPPQATTER